MLSRLLIAGLLGILLSSPALSQAYLVISEFMASNTSTLADEDGEFVDWIEIRNAGTAAQDLAGFHLSDDPLEPDQWTFPSVTIAPGGYLVIFASSKDRRLAGSELHTNFKLSAGGDYIGLFSPSLGALYQYPNPFPPQSPDVSFGTKGASTTLPGVYFSTPTPGSANGPGDTAVAAPPGFSQQRGYYDQPVLLNLGSESGTSIRYTLDGSSPTETFGTVYSGSITLDTTSVVRAMAYGAGFLGSKVVTHTYIMVDEVITSPVMQTAITQDPVYGPQMRASLLEYPALSIVTGNVINPDTARGASIEFIDPTGEEPGFHITAGVKQVGGHSLRHNPKKSMRLFFKTEFGASKLEYPVFAASQPFAYPATDRFDQIHLRSGSHDSIFYMGDDNQAPANAQYIRNRWMQDTQFRMGQPATHGRWTHVFINGVYWGQYHMMERATESFMDEYFTGAKEDFAFTNSGIKDDVDVWAMVKASATSVAAAEPWIDMESLIDYQLLHFYSGNNWDWLENHNWMAAGPRTPNGEGWKFFAWDSDMMFVHEDANNTDPTALSRTNNPMNAPGGVFADLRTDPEFLIKVADRAYKHLFNSGVLTPPNVVSTWSDLTDEIALSLVAETARWSPGGAWTINGDWIPERDRILNSMIPGRTNTVIAQLIAEGLYPAINPPEFSSAGESYNQFLGEVPTGFQLTMTNANPSGQGAIYYTLDGQDPRAEGGGINVPSAIHGADLKTIPIAGVVTVNARIQDAGMWSALQTATFHAPQMLDKLVINEIHYHPHDEGEVGTPGFIDGDEFEFIELKNVSADVLHLQGIRLTEGIAYEFGPGAQIDPGGFIVLAENAAEFENRYGFAPFDQYSGKLANSGETVKVTDFSGAALDEVAYSDVAPWPQAPDGFGTSLSLKPGHDNATPADWGSSADIGGSPGAENTVAIVLSLNVALQGPWKSAGMSTALNASGMIPAEHPFDDVPAGGVGPAFFFDHPEVVDWVWIDIRTSPDPSTSVFKEAMLVTTSGGIVDVVGSPMVAIPGVPAGSYYVVVGGRNHLAVIGGPVVLD